MPRNGSGTMSVPNTFTPNTVIASAEVNANFVDFATEITNSVARDGQGGMLAELSLDATGWSYSADPDTGMRRTAANTQVIEVGAVDVVTFTTSTVTFAVPITFPGATSTLPYVITGSTAAFTPFQGVSTEAGADAGPIFEAYRNSASPAASDFIGAFHSYGKDSGGTKTLYGELVWQITDPTDTSEDSIFVLRAMIAGTLTDMIRSSSTGIAIPGALAVTGAIAGSSTIAGTNITASGALSGATAAGAMLASAAEQETGTAADKLVTPSVQHRHQSAAKTWANLDGTGVIALRVSSNVSGVTDNGDGDYSFDHATDFSTANYSTVAAGQRPSTNNGFCTTIMHAGLASPSTGTIRMGTADGTGTATDAEIVCISCFGDQA